MALIEITLTIDGQAGPFDLFSDVDNYAAPFDTQVPAALLTAGYIVNAPAGTATVRVCSTGVCTNCIDIPTNCPTTTTTTSSSTSTTTSTSSSTTTSTTTIKEVKLNWELITNTPSSLVDAFPQSSNLKIDVNGNNVVDATITGNANSQSGQINVAVGDVVSATIETTRTGLYNFVNSISKNGVLYQAQDTCFGCTNSFTTLMSPDYTENGSVDPVAFTFIADSYKEETTTTTTSSSTSSTTSTTSTSSSSTTTTTTTCDCSLGTGTAIVTQGTTTTSTSKLITTSTTTTNLGPAYAGIRTQNGQAVTGCNDDLSNFVWKDGVSDIPAIGDFIYSDAQGNTPFNGSNLYYGYQPAIASPDPITYNIQIDQFGEIQSSVPCNA